MEFGFICMGLVIGLYLGYVLTWREVSLIIKREQQLADEYFAKVSKKTDDK